MTENLRKLPAPTRLTHRGCLRLLTRVLKSRKLPWRCLEPFGRDIPKALPPLVLLSFTLLLHHSQLLSGFLPRNVRGLLRGYRNFLLQSEGTLGRFEDFPFLNLGKHTLRVLYHGLLVEELRIQGAGVLMNQMAEVLGHHRVESRPVFTDKCPEMFKRGCRATGRFLSYGVRASVLGLSHRLLLNL